MRLGMGVLVKLHSLLWKHAFDSRAQMERIGALPKCPWSCQGDRGSSLCPFYERVRHLWASFMMRFTLDFSGPRGRLLSPLTVWAFRPAGSPGRTSCDQGRHDGEPGKLLCPLKTAGLDRLCLYWLQAVSCATFGFNGGGGWVGVKGAARSFFPLLKMLRT